MVVRMYVRNLSQQANNNNNDKMYRFMKQVPFRQWPLDMDIQNVLNIIAFNSLILKCQQNKIKLIIKQISETTI